MIPRLQELGAAILVFIELVIPNSFVHAKDVKESLLSILESKEFIEIKASEGIALDLRYATKNNFTGQNLYQDFNRTFLNVLAAEKLKIAVQNLRSEHPSYKLVIFDALRPRSVQFLLWDRVKGTEKEKYVANPNSGSIHNYGFAIDLSIVDESGHELDMGTPFDDFTPLAQPKLEKQYLKEKKLTGRQISNRLLLRKVMESAGFVQLPIEWWHFDALPRARVTKDHKIVE